jgi:hypothetical protein
MSTKEQTMTLRILSFLFTMMAGVLGLTVPAAAIDGMLYELTESVKLRGNDDGYFKSSMSTLAGYILPGTPLCPTWLAVQLNLRSCTIVVHAVGNADDVTGVGPATGQFDIVIQDRNQIDPPETPIIRGRLMGTLDLEPAFQRRVPLGSIRGGFSASGLEGTIMAGTTVRGGFEGTFRLPFMHAGVPSYLMDDNSVQPAQATEMFLGNALVRVELRFGTRASRPSDASTAPRVDEE